MSIVNPINKKYITITTKIAKLQGQLKELQAECTHPNKTMQYKGNTGNYDPSSDSYWIEHYCPDCHKLWTTPQ